MDAFVLVDLLFYTPNPQKSQEKLLKLTVLLSSLFACFMALILFFLFLLYRNLKQKTHMGLCNSSAGVPLPLITPYHFFAVHSPTDTLHSYRSCSKISDLGHFLLLQCPEAHHLTAPQGPLGSLAS